MQNRYPAVLSRCVLENVTTDPSLPSVTWTGGSNRLLVKRSLIGLAIGLYRPSGFDYPQVLALSELSPGGEPFALYANLGKATARFITLVLLFNAPYPSFKPVKTMVANMALVLLLTGIIFVVAIPLAGLEWQLKAAEAIIKFAAVNLLITCVAEEAFLRLVVQRELSLICARHSRHTLLIEAIPIILMTVLFVVTHAVNSAEVYIIYAVAGGLYALRYTLTKNVFACIALHFLINFIHFSFLTYPM